MRPAPIQPIFSFCSFPFAANTFFDRELNAYFCHVAGDSNDNGVMWGVSVQEMSKEQGQE